MYEYLGSYMFNSRFFCVSDTEKKDVHVTQFMLDMKGPSRGVTLQDFVRRESDYDMAFCTAWLYAFDQTQLVTEDSVESIMQLFDEIHTLSIKHLPEFHEVKLGQKVAYQPKQGRSYQNYYGLLANWNCNLNGVFEIADKILGSSGKSFNQLNIKIENSVQRYILKEDGLFLFTGQNLAPLNKTKVEIFQIIEAEYNKGPCSDGCDRLILMSVKNIEEKKRKESELFSQYFNNIKHAVIVEEKIRIIIELIQSLEQLHLYWDGNARALYILANYLMVKHGLQLFYPETLCIFDGNSVDKIFADIVYGQKIFADLFASEEQLTTKLKTYHEAVSQLRVLIGNLKIDERDLERLKTSFTNREFNLLLRQAAVRENMLELLSFLVENAEQLGIDIYSRGKTAGTVFDVATKNENNEGMVLLNKYFTSELTQSKGLT